MLYRHSFADFVIHCHATHIHILLLLDLYLFILFWPARLSAVDPPLPVAPVAQASQPLAAHSSTMLAAIILPQYSYPMSFGWTVSVAKNGSGAVRPSSSLYSRIRCSVCWHSNGLTSVVDRTRAPLPTPICFRRLPAQSLENPTGSERRRPLWIRDTAGTACAWHSQ